MIEIRRVTFAYSGKPPLFEDFNWRVNAGESWSVLGASGCGKSTLLSLIAGLQQPDSGEVLVNGKPVTRPRPETGYIIQDYGLLPWQTIRENVRLGLRIRNAYPADGVHAPEDYTPTIEVDPWLERLGLAEVAEQYPNRVSGGQRQRAAIARTLTLNPDLLLMDEPFSSLDASTRASLQQLVLSLWQEQKLTMITVTHSIEEAVILGQKILLLGTPPNVSAEIIDNPLHNEPGFRDSDAYLQLVSSLRRRLEAA